MLNLRAYDFFQMATKSPQRLARSSPTPAVARAFPAASRSRMVACGSDAILEARRLLSFLFSLERKAKKRLGCTRRESDD